MKVFIWGGTSGIGASLARRYSLLGHHVVVAGRSEAKFKKEFKGAFQNISFENCDIQKRKKVKKCIETQWSKGDIDLYIISSGISVNKKSHLEELDRTIEIFKTNIMGTLYAVEAIFPYFKDRKKGHLALFGSVAGLKTLHLNSGYSASKGAIHSLGHSWHKNWKEIGVCVSTIIPGFIRTPLTEKNCHPMPFLLEVRDGAEIIFSGLEKKKAVISFPGVPYWGMKFLTFLPGRVSDKILEWLKIY